MPINLRRERLRDPSATPPARPAIAAPVASAGAFVLEAVPPIVLPALLVASATALRADSTRPAPLALERFVDVPCERCLEPLGDRRWLELGFERDPELPLLDEALRFAVERAVPLRLVALPLFGVVLRPLRDEAVRALERVACD